METGETDKAKQVMRDEHIHLSPQKNEPAEPVDEKSIHNGRPIFLERH